MQELDVVYRVSRITCHVGSIQVICSREDVDI